MQGNIYIDNDEIGSADLKVIDVSMGVIQGELRPITSYNKYKKRIQDLFDSKGIANSDDFNITIILGDQSILNPDGGIGIIDSSRFDEILVEAAGLKEEIIAKMNV